MKTECLWILHLCPRNTPSFHVWDLPPLPPFRNAIDVLANFPDYLFQCTRMHIEENHACGPDIWALFGDNTDFVLSHPKERQGPQQAKIRQAAAQAGPVPDIPEGQARIRLATEGEASLCCCPELGNPADGFMVWQSTIYQYRGVSTMAQAIDTGETTININSYYVTSSESPPTLHEIAPAECRLQGSFRVTQPAGQDLQGNANPLLTAWTHPT